MRKHWVAMLSMLGLAGAGVRVQAQVVKGSTTGKTTTSNTQTTQGSSHAQKTGNSKLDLKQETLRQQNGVNGSKSGQTQKAVGQNTGTCRYSEGCQTQNNQLTKGNQAITKGNQQITKGNANTQLTPPPPGANQQLTKGNQAITKGNQQITKGTQAITKGNQQITKGNQAITKGNQAITKGNQAITKGNQQLTKGNQAITK